MDFTYEVSRSLAACEGAILVVDASQGIQAQTLSNLFLAMEAGLEIIPILNKIDLPGAEPEQRRAEVVGLLGCDPDDILLVSAKEGIGIVELLEKVIEKTPPPKGDPKAPLRALVFDSYYDRYRGAVPSIRVVDGTIQQGHAHHVRRERRRVRSAGGRLQPAPAGADRGADGGRGRLRRRRPCDR